MSSSGAIKTAVGTKELRENCHVSLPTLFYVALQKGWWELTTKVESGKEGLWAGKAAADGNLAEETLLAENARNGLPSSSTCDSVVESAGVPCKVARSIQFSAVGTERKHTPLNFFLLPRNK